MMAYALQLVLCYCLIGLIMASMLGGFSPALPGNRIPYMLLVFFIIGWLPAAILTLFAAPIANSIMVQEKNRRQ